MPLMLKKTPEELQPMVKRTLMLKGVRPGSKARVIWAIDVSGSMNDELRSGLVQLLADRVLPIGIELDDNGAVDVYAFDTEVYRMPTYRKEGKELRVQLTAENYHNFVDKYIQRLGGGGTNYAPVMRAILEDLEPGIPAFVIFMTDGDNYDKPETTEIMTKASELPVFWQFVGLDSRGNTGFPYLQKLDDLRGRTVDNADLSVINLNTVTDQQLYDNMLKEYGSYPGKAEKAKVLPWAANKTWASLNAKQRKGWF